jgi:hypothetical protein
MTSIYYFLIFFGICLVVGLASIIHNIIEKNQKGIKIGSIVFVTPFILFGFSYIFSSPATNFKTAYIEKRNENFIITVKGKRVLMAHDLVSIFWNKTYEDSIQYIVPRNQGTIKGEEIPVKSDYYGSIGTIVIQGNKMTIDLFTDNYDDQILEPDGWNGKYDLVWRTK